MSRECLWPVSTGTKSTLGKYIQRHTRSAHHVKNVRAHYNTTEIDGTRIAHPCFTPNFTKIGKINAWNRNGNEFGAPKSVQLLQLSISPTFAVMAVKLLSKLPLPCDVHKEFYLNHKKLKNRGKFNFCQQAQWGVHRIEFHKTRLPLTNVQRNSILNPIKIQQTMKSQTWRKTTSSL